MKIFVKMVLFLQMSTNFGKLVINEGCPVVCDHQKILQKWPIVTDKDKNDIINVLDKGEFSGRNSTIVKKLENNLENYLQSRNVVLLNSGTAALHSCIAALGIGPGDEVIVPSFTFLASAISVLHNCAIPVFCDIDEKTFNIDPHKIETLISSRTKAIMVVHMQGLPANMLEINKIAARYGLYVIEDCAQSFGAEIGLHKCGTFGDMGAFSLMSAKQLATCGELGAVCTNSLRLKNLANMVKMYGEILNKDGSRTYNSYSMGYNYTPNTLQAQFALNKLNEFNEGISKIIENAKYLSNIIKDEFDFLIPPYTPIGYKHVYHFYRVIVDGTKRGYQNNRVLNKAIMEIMESEGLNLRHYQTIPVSGQQVFQTMEGFGHGFPWKVNKNRIKFYKENYNIYNYPETLKMLSESFVIGGIGSAPQYFQSKKTIDLYINGFRKIKNNWSKVIKYAKKIESSYIDPWSNIVKISDTQGSFSTLNYFLK